MHEMRDKFGSTREKVSRFFRSIRDFGKEGSEVSISAPTYAANPHESTYSLAQRLPEAKLKEVHALAYQRLFDQPK